MTSAHPGVEHPGLTAVILAAGEGRRAGRFKPLADLAGRRAIDRVIAAASAACGRIRVVGGARFEDLRDYLATSDAKVELLRNDRWRAGGMFSSVQLGLARLDGAAFVHPVDIPGPGPAVYRRLADELARAADAVLRPAHGGRPGHPVLLAPAAVARIVDADPGLTLREVLAQLPRRDVDVDDELILHDCDTAEDFGALERLLTARDRSEE